MTSTEAPKPWSDWPAIARWPWLIGRPACTLAAAATPWFSVRWSVALIVVSAVLVVRPVTRWYVGLALAAGLGAVVPLSGLLVLARLAIGEAVLHALGRGRTVLGLPGVTRGRRAAGLQRVRSARNQLLVRLDLVSDVAADPETAWILMQRRLRGRLMAPAGERLEDVGAFDLEEGIIAYLFVAWCDADVVATGRALRRVTAGVVLGRWDVGDYVVPDESEELVRQLPLAVVEAAPRGVAVIAAAVICGLLVDGEGWGIGPVTVSRAVLAALLGAYVTVEATTRPPSRAVVVAVVGLGAIVLRWDAPVAGAIGYALGRGVWYARRRVEDHMMAGPRPGHHPRTLTWRDTTIRRRGAWRAGELATHADRPGIAIEILHRLARDASAAAPAVAAAALSRIGVLELRRGRVQAAADATAAAWQLVAPGATAETERRLRGRRRWRRTEALARAGVAQVRLELGQEVVDVLPDLAHLPARWSETREARRICIDALIRAGRPEEALTIIASTHQGLRGARDMLTMIDSQVAAAQALVATGEHQVAKTYLLDEVRPRIETLTATALTEDQQGDDLDIKARVAVIAGRSSLLVGQVELDEGRAHPALEALELAAERLRSTGAHTLLTTALVLKGAALTRLNRWTEAVDAIRDGVDALEAQRRQLTSGDARTQAILSAERLYRTAFHSLHDAQVHGRSRRAGPVAGALMEALHQSALADALRTARFDAGPGHADLALAFAQAYQPREVDLAELAAACSPGHALSYYHCPLDGGPTGYCVWLPPSGSPVIHVLTVDHPEAVELLDYLGTRDGTEPLCLRRPPRSPAHADTWTSLARALLPPALLDQMTQTTGSNDEGAVHLVVVPDGPLARLPWPALLVDGRRTLAEVAVVQMVPALELLDPGLDGGTARSGGPVILHADPDLMDDTASEAFVRDMEARTGLHLVARQSHDELIAALQDESWAGVILAAHGVGSGLDQHVRLGDRRLLSMADSLIGRLRWPPWVFFGSCFVGSVEQRLGGEPLGLPIVCLLGGAHTVIGGTVEVDDPRTDRLSRTALAALGDRIHPAHALRHGQLGLVGSRVNGWAAFTCISRVPPGWTPTARPQPSRPFEAADPQRLHPTAIPATADPDVVDDPGAAVPSSVSEGRGPDAVGATAGGEGSGGQALVGPVTTVGDDAAAWAPIEPPVDRNRPAQPATRAPEPPSFPRSTRPRPSGGALRQRWDWPRVKAALLALSLGPYALLLVKAIPSATTDAGVLGGVAMACLAGLCGFYALRNFRRARDAQGVVERRRAKRQSDVDSGRNVASRPSARGLSDQPPYSAAVVDVLHAAEAAAGGVTTRQNVVAALGTAFDLPAATADAANPVVVQLDPADHGDIVMASEELAACLTTATRLAWAYAMNRVERGHLATALAYSVTGDVNDTRRRLHASFGDDFTGLDAVLTATDPTPAASPLDPRHELTGSRSAPHSDGRRGLTHRAAQRRAATHAPPPPARDTLLRAGYLVGAAILLTSLGGMVADIPGRLAETRDMQQARHALDAGRYEEAYRLFSEMAEREPDSITAHVGRGCAAARTGDLDRWAMSENEALLVGMPLRDAGACLDPQAASRFHVAVAERIALLVPTPPPTGRRSDVDATLTVIRSRRQFVEVVADASCAAGSASLPTYAQHLAGAALRIAPYSLVDRTDIAATLRACVQSWPPGEARDVVSSWVEET